MSSSDELVYLASCYSHPDPAVRELRYQQACKAAAILMRRGINVVSPIAHGHGIARAGIDGDFAAWRKLDTALLNVCARMIVLTLPGWRGSAGIKAEIEIMEGLGKPVEYLPPDGLELDL